MTPEELPGYLRALRERAAYAVIPAADAMGSHFEHRVKERLTERSHVRGTRTPAPEGGPPAMESGSLAASVAMVPASTPVVAVSSVAPHRSPRDWVQEWGVPEIHVRRAPFMHFWYDGERFEKVVHIPSRSYIRSTRDMLIADGSLREAAARAFYEALWG